MSTLRLSYAILAKRRRRKRIRYVGRNGILTSMTNKEFYTTEELAERLRVNIMTIYRYIKAGRLKAHKIGKEFRIPKDEFDRFLKNTSTK